MVMKRSTWLSVTLLCLMLSIISMFLPVLTYEYAGGKRVVDFSVLDFFEPDELSEVLSYYTGSFSLTVDSSVATFLAILAVLAIVAAFVGVITMSAQRPNKWQFILSIVGLVGTLIPSVLVFTAVLLSFDYFPGTFSFGVYPVITPISMGICMYMVTRKHKRTQAELEAEKRAAQHWHAPGDLD